MTDSNTNLAPRPETERVREYNVYFQKEGVIQSAGILATCYMKALWDAMLTLGLSREDITLIV